MSFTVFVSVPVKQVYLTSGEGDDVTLSAPVTNGTEFTWDWTSHDRRHRQALIATVTSDGTWSWVWRFTESFLHGSQFDINLKPRFENGGLFSFSQTEPTHITLAQFEVFAVQVKSSQSPRAALGSDVALSCTVSHLPEPLTIQWRRDGNATANSTVLYNNTAYIIIHNVLEGSQGRYVCRLSQNGAQYHVAHNVSVHTLSSNQQHTLYREIRNCSELVLIHRSLQTYPRVSWMWLSSPSANHKLIAQAEVQKHPRLFFPFQSRFSSPVYDGYSLPLSISPLMFSDSGQYNVFVNSAYTTINLITLRASAEPSGVLFGNESVVLTCEVSTVLRTLTLAWLRMKGGKGLLVRQETVRSQTHIREFSLTLNNISRDDSHWECVVFTGTVFRGKASVRLTLSASLLGKGASRSRSRDLTWLVVCGVLIACAFLLGIVLFFCRRKTAAPPATAEKGDEVIYNSLVDVTQDEAPGCVIPAEAQDGDICYATLTVAQSSGGGKSQVCHPPDADNSGESEEPVIYSVVNTANEAYIPCHV